MVSENIIEEIPIFDGFPYRVTRITGSYHHIILLPGKSGFSHFSAFTRKQARANRLAISIAVLGLRLRPARSAFEFHISHGLVNCVEVGRQMKCAPQYRFGDSLEI